MVRTGMLVKATFVAAILRIGMSGPVYGQAAAADPPNGFIPPFQQAIHQGPNGAATPPSGTISPDSDLPGLHAPTYAPPVSMPPLAAAPACGAPACGNAECAGCVGGLFVDAEYLLMKPTRRQTDFVIIDPSRDGTPQGTIESVSWDTDSGFRVGGGYGFPGAGWEVGGYYTYFHSSGHDFASSPAGGTLFATLTHPGGIEQVDTADAGTAFNYQIFDIEVGRRFEVGDSFTVRVFGGGRFAWIKQSLNVLYNGGDATNAFVASPIKFNGAGLRVGGEGYWNFWRGFSLFARAGASLLEGNFHTSLLETNNNGGTINVNVSDSFENMVPVAELGLGVAWHYRNIFVTASYEMTNWFNMVDSPSFVDDTDQGKMARRQSDLSLQGLAVRMGMSF